MRNCPPIRVRASIARFTLGREAVPIAEMTPAQITEYITANGWQPSTMRSYLVDLRSLFAFAVEREYLRKSPAAAVPLPRLDESAPGILSPEQARAFLDACLEVAPDAMPVVVLCLFGGLRRAEAEQIEWSEIGPEFLELKAHKAKTRRRRWVPISGQLRAWLEAARSAACPLPGVGYAGRLKRIADKAGMRDDWPQNALRHSFASYHFAKFRKDAETASIMGTSAQMLFQHYRELVRPEAAEVFFGLLPAADTAARIVEVRAALAEATRQARVAAAYATHRSQAERKQGHNAAAPTSNAGTAVAPIKAADEKAGPVEALPGLE